MAANKCKFEIDTRQDFSNTGGLEEPVGADLSNLVRDLSVIDLVLISICDDDLAARVLFSKLLHPAKDQRSEVVENVSQKDELLRIEQRCIYIIEELGALNGNTHASHLVFFVPELLHLFVKAL